MLCIFNVISWTETRYVTPTAEIESLVVEVGRWSIRVGPSGVLAPTINMPSGSPSLLD